MESDCVTISTYNTYEPKNSRSQLLSNLLQYFALKYNVLLTHQTFYCIYLPVKLMSIEFLHLSLNQSLVLKRTGSFFENAVVQILQK